MTCIVDYKHSPAVLRCTICNKTAPFPLPMTIDQLIVITDQFKDQHRPCSSVAERRICNPEVVGSTPTGGSNG